jgi:predicted transcriptional regulator
MFTARDAIEMRLREIREERRALLEEYHRLLDVLRSMDEKAASEGSDVYALSNELKQAITEVKEIIPTVTVEDVIRHLVAKYPTLPEQVIPPQQEEKGIAASPVFQKALFEAKDEEARNKKPLAKEHRKKVVPSNIPLTGPKRTGVISSFVKEILQDVGKSLSPIEIRQELNDRYGIQYAESSIHTLLSRLVKSEPWLQKAGFGAYKYVGEEEAQQESKELTNGAAKEIATASEVGERLV